MSSIDAIDKEATEDQLEKLIEMLLDPWVQKSLLSHQRLKKKQQVGLLSQQVRFRKEEVASTIGMVVKIGPDAYQDKVRFPNGAWCKVGDFVITRAYSGTRGKVMGKRVSHCL